MIAPLFGCTILALYCWFTRMADPKAPLPPSPTRTSAFAPGSRAANSTQSMIAAINRSGPRRNPNRHNRATVFPPSTFTVFPPFNLTADFSRDVVKQICVVVGAPAVKTGHPDTLSHAQPNVRKTADYQMSVYWSTLFIARHQAVS